MLCGRGAGSAGAAGAAAPAALAARGQKNALLRCLTRVLTYVVG